MATKAKSPKVKKAKKSANLPMVPTTDKMKLKSGKEIVFRPIERPSIKDRKEHMFEKFKKDGLLPEIRLLMAIFGEEACKDDIVPEKDRTRATYNKLHRDFWAAELKMQKEEEIITGGKRLDVFSPKVKKHINKLISDGFSIAKIAKEIGTNVFSIKFFLDGNDHKPHILLLGEALLKIAKKNKDEKLRKKAEAKIAEGKEIIRVMAEKDKAARAAERNGIAAAKKYCKVNNLTAKRIYLNCSGQDTKALKKLVANGTIKPGNFFFSGFESVTVFNGKKFVNV